MTRDEEILDQWLAEELSPGVGPGPLALIRRVREDEREECAKLATEVGQDGHGAAGEIWADRIASAIRTRDEKLSPKAKEQP